MVRRSSILSVTFETLKADAKVEVSRMLRHEGSMHSDGFNATALIEALPSALEELTGSSTRNRQICSAKTAELEQQAHRLIDKWDVREVTKLVEAFPNIIPKKYRGASVQCELRDSGGEDGSSWVVVFRSSPTRRRAPAGPGL